MAEIRRVGSLEVSQDIRFQRYQLIAQHWGWLALLMVIAAALAGILGSGPLSDTSNTAPDGSIRVEYDRFLRRSATATLVSSLAPNTTQDGVVRLRLDQSYLRKVRVLQVTPRPEREEAGLDHHTFIFRASTPGRPIEVMLHFEPREMGSLRGRLSVGDGPELEFTHFVYP